MMMKKSHLLIWIGLFQYNPENVFFIIVSLSVIIFFLGIFWFFFTTYQINRYRSQIEGIGHEIRTTLKELRPNLVTLEQGTKDYPTSDPPPYQTLALDLHQLVATIAQQYGEYSTRLNQQFNYEILYPEGFFRVAWFNLWQARGLWSAQLQESNELSDRVEQLTVSVDNALALLTALKEVPLRVSEQACELRQSIAQCLKINQALRNVGVYGNSLDSAATQVVQLEAELNKIPTYLFSNHNLTRIKQAPKSEIVAAWKILLRIGTRIEQQLKVFERWQSEFQQIRTTVETMDQLLNQAVTAVKQIPKTIDIESLAQDLLEAFEKSKELREWYGALTIDMFYNFHEAVLEVSEEAKRIISVTEGLAQLLQILRRAGTEVEESLIQIENIMKQGAQIVPYSIQWGQFRNDFLKLQRDRERVGLLTKKRTIPQLHEDAETGAMLAKKAQRLHRQVDKIWQQREELLPLLQRSDLQTEATWPAEAKELQQQVNQYFRENWSRQHSTNSIEKDAKKLLNRCKSEVPKNTLAASTMDVYLTNLQSLAKDLDSFHDRVKQVKNELDELKDAEHTAKQQLETISEPLGEILEQMEPIDRPEDQNIQNQQRKLEKLWKQNEKLQSQLDRRDRGVVAKKVKQAEKWGKNCQKDLQPLPNMIQAEIKAMETELKKILRPSSLESSTEWKAIKQAATVNRPSRMPPCGKELKTDIEKIEFLMGQIKPQLQDREDLHTTLLEAHHLTENLVTENGDFI